MNTVYHELKGEFVADKSYKGSDIHGVILNTVKVGGHDSVSVILSA